MQRIERSSSPLSWAFATFSTHDSTKLRRSSSDSVSVGNAISQAVCRRVQYSRSDMSWLQAARGAASAPSARVTTTAAGRIPVVYHGRAARALLDRAGGAARHGATEQSAQLALGLVRRDLHLAAERLHLAAQHLHAFSELLHRPLERAHLLLERAHLVPQLAALARQLRAVVIAERIAVLAHRQRRLAHGERALPRAEQALLRAELAHLAPELALLAAELALRLAELLDRLPQHVD